MQGIGRGEKAEPARETRRKHARATRREALLGAGRATGVAEAIVASAQGDGHGGAVGSRRRQTGTGEVVEAAGDDGRARGGGGGGDKARGRTQRWGKNNDSTTDTNHNSGRSMELWVMGDVTWQQPHDGGNAQQTSVMYSCTPYEVAGQYTSGEAHCMCVYVCLPSQSHGQADS